jgi:putative flavoprotein involved in K+ transport
MSRSDGVRSDGIPSSSSSLTGHCNCLAMPIKGPILMATQKDEFVGFLEEYASNICAPLRCETEVVALRDIRNSRSMILETSRGVIEAKNVVVATGPFQAPKIPPLSRDLPSEIFQIHARDYRNPAQLPQGAVLVVGSGASGTQIAEELHRSGRKVFLAVGRFHKTPRRYRGRDCYWWFDKLGYWHTPLASMPPESKNLRFVVTAVDGGHDVDLRQYAADGIILAGRLKRADQQNVEFHADLEKTLAEGDDWYAKFRRQMDDYANQCAPPLPAELDQPPPRTARSSNINGILQLNLSAEGISSVVWASGYTCDFSWIKIPVLDGNGDPVHERGVTKRAGLYFLGLRRTYSIGSALVAGWSTTQPTLRTKSQLQFKLPEFALRTSRSPWYKLGTTKFRPVLPGNGRSITGESDPTPTR